MFVKSNAKKNRPPGTESLVLPDTDDFMHRPTRSVGGKFHAVRFSAGAPRWPMHGVVRVGQDETVILIIHQIILDAFHPYTVLRRGAESTTEGEPS